MTSSVNISESRQIDLHWQPWLTHDPDATSWRRQTTSFFGHVLISVMWQKLITVRSHYQGNIQNICWFQMFKCGDFLLLFLLYHCKLNIFRFCRRTKQLDAKSIHQNSEMKWKSLLVAALLLCCILFSMRQLL